MIKKAIIAFLLTTVITGIGFSQGNLVVGFNGGYAIAGNNNNILQAYNNQNNNLTEEFKDLKYMFGLEVGFSYRTGLSAVTVTYQNSRRRRAAKGIIDQDMVFERSLNYIMSSYSVGFEAGPKNLNLGVTIGSRTVNIKSKIGNSSDFKTLNKERNWISKVYLNIGTRGNKNNSFAIRPYFEFAWDDTDITEVNNSLIGSKPLVQDKFHVIGISLIFYNGPQ